jgi:hypothetical protein
LVISVLPTNVFDLTTITAVSSIATWLVCIDPQAVRKTKSESRYICLAILNMD